MRILSKKSERRISVRDQKLCTILALQSSDRFPKVRGAIEQSAQTAVRDKENMLRVRKRRMNQGNARQNRQRTRSTSLAKEAKQMQVTE